MCESSCPKADRKKLLGHHSQVRREPMGLWWGEEGAQTRGSLHCLFFTFFLFSIKITCFWKEPPEEERIAALCVNF